MKRTKAGQENRRLWGWGGGALQGAEAGVKPREQPKEYQVQQATRRSSTCKGREAGMG